LIEPFRDHLLGLARTAEQYRTTNGADKTSVKRFKPERAPTTTGNQGKVRLPKQGIAQRFGGHVLVYVDL
jgi:hypothetical protein